MSALPTTAAAPRLPGVLSAARSPLRIAGPPLIAFVLAQAAPFIAAHVQHFSSWSPASWNRFDSDYYVSISQSGYSIGPCGAGHPAGTWCGNSGWFPGYPLVSSLLVQLGAPARAAALVVSLACCLAALTLVWVGFLRAQPSAPNFLCLGLAAFAPGQIYYHTIFPLAVAALAMLLVIFFLGRERFALAGVAGAVLAASYPSGGLIVPVTALWLLFRGDGAPFRSRVVRILLTSGIAALGAAFVPLTQKIQTGYWDAFFKVHAHYNNHFHSPFPALVKVVKPVFHGGPTVRAIPHWEAAFAACLVVLLVGLVIAGRGPAGPLDSLLALILVAFWLVPLSITHMDLYRSDALLIPAALLLRRAPLPVGIAAVACGAALSVPMAEAFLVRVLG